MFQNRKASFVSITIISILLSANASFFSFVYNSLASLSIDENSSPIILGSVSDFQVVRSVTFLIVEGVVQNVLDETVKVNVTATFYDAGNRSVGVQCHETDLALIRPGQLSPFTFYWPTNFTDITYKLELSYEETAEQSVDILEPRDVVNQTEGPYLVLRGEIWNGRPLKALGVSVACILYDSEGSFDGLARTFVPSVDAGGSSEFQLYLDSSLDIGSYDLVLYAGGYEERSIANIILFTVLVVIFLFFILFMKRRGW